MPRDIPYNYYSGPPDEPVCPECSHLLDVDGDSDGVSQWNIFTCLNAACPESPEFNEDDPREDR